MPKVQAIDVSPAGSRGSRSRRVATTLAEINVVPLVDVMLVLLIIFMVTAPMMQRGLDVNLPVSKRAEQIVGQRIFISVPLSYRQQRIVYVNNDPVRIEILHERIRRELGNGRDRDVYVQGDGRLNLQELFDVWDKLKEAGVEKVGMVARLPGER